MSVADTVKAAAIPSQASDPAAAPGLPLSRPLAPSQPSPRLVPALVGGLRVYLECPTWCTLDHVAENEGFLEDVCHSGDVQDVTLPAPGGGLDMLLMARLGADPAAGGEPYVTVDDTGSLGAYLSPEQALSFASDLIAFAGHVQAMARTAISARAIAEHGQAH